MFWCSQKTPQDVKEEHRQSHPVGQFHDAQPHHCQTPPNNNDMLLLVFLTQSHDTVGSLKYKILDKFETYGEIS